MPDVLLSGNHGAIRDWRRRAALVQTMLKRPDMLMDQTLSKGDMELMKKLQQDIKTIIGKHTEAS